MIELLEAVPGPWLVLAGVALTAVGAVAGARLSARSKDRETTATATDRLIDQLQEERDGYRREHEARLSNAETRLTGMEERNGILVTQNDRYRDLLHKHRAHIYDQLPPPPPEWPEDLPR